MTVFTRQTRAVDDGGSERYGRVVASGHIAGRRTEQATLQDALGLMRRGIGSVVVLTGEPGSGKTALAEWLTGEAIADGCTVVRSRCEGPGVLSASFSGWTRETATEGLPFEHVESLSALFADGGDQVAGPTLLILEDVQWGESRMFAELELAVRELDRRALLLLVTASTSGAYHAGPLANVLAVARHASRYLQIDLKPLTVDAIAEMIEIHAVAATDRNIARRIHSRSDGNASFAAMLIGHLATSGDAPAVGETPATVPPEVTATVIGRLKGLSEATLEVARIASVLGREFEGAELEAVPGLGAEMVDAGLDELETAGVIAATGHDRFRFVHGLVREVLYAMLPTRRRSRLHESAVAFLLSLPATGRTDATRLAYHFEQLDDRARALEYWREAAVEYEAARDWPAAIDCIERCLSLLPGEGRAVARERAPLLLALGRCYRSEHEVRHAWRLLMEAIALYREAADGPGMAQVILEALRIPAPPERREELIRHAFAAIEGNPDPDIEAQLLLQQTVWTAGPTTDEASQRATALAAAHGPDIRPLLAHGEGSAALRDGRPEEARRLFLQLHEASAAQGRTGWALQLLAGANTIPLFAGDLLRGVAATKRAVAAAEKAGSALHAAGLMTWLAGAAFAVGDAATVAALLDRAEQVNPLHFGIAWLRAAQAEVAGRTDEAVTLMPGTDGLGGQPAWLAVVHGARARILHHAGDDDGARHELARWEFYWRTVAAQPAAPTASFVNTMAAVDDVLPALGERAILEDIYAELQRWSWARFAPSNGCGLDQLRGALASHLGRNGEAEEHYQTGHAWALREGCPVAQARCLLGLAEIEGAKGAHTESERLLRDAGKQFRKAGAELYLRQVEALLAHPGGPDEPRDNDGSPIGGLSRREVEVLNLIAAGHTNAQIASELHISTNTVARHVTHILVKTGGANRAEATSYAYRHALIAPARDIEQEE